MGRYQAQFFNFPVMVSMAGFLLEKIMLIEVDYKKFQEKLNAYAPEKPYTVEEATEAFHNLVGLVRLFREVEQEVCGRKNLRSPSS